MENLIKCNSSKKYTASDGSVWELCTEEYESLVYQDGEQTATWLAKFIMKNGQKLGNCLENDTGYGFRDDYVFEYEYRGYLILCAQKEWECGKYHCTIINIKSNSYYIDLDTSLFNMSCLAYVDYHINRLISASNLGLKNCGCNKKYVASDSSIWELMQTKNAVYLLRNNKKLLLDNGRELSFVLETNSYYRFVYEYKGYLIIYKGYIYKDCLPFHFEPYFMINIHTLNTYNHSGGQQTNFPDTALNFIDKIKN